MLSGAQLYHALPDVKVVRYVDLKKYKTLEELLPPSKEIIILYPVRDCNDGHWTAGYLKNKTFYFFDSYGDAKFGAGGLPDDQLDYRVPDYKGPICDQTYFLKLIKDSPYELDYNNFVYQSEKADTCGMWCIAYLFFKRGNDGFRSLFYPEKGVNLDTLVEKFVKKIFFSV